MFMYKFFVLLGYELRNINAKDTLEGSGLKDGFSFYGRSDSGGSGLAWFYLCRCHVSLGFQNFRHVMSVQEFKEALFCSTLERSSPSLSLAVRYSLEMVVIWMNFPLEGIFVPLTKLKVFGGSVRSMNLFSSGNFRYLEVK